MGLFVDELLGCSNRVLFGLYIIGVFDVQKMLYLYVHNNLFLCVYPINGTNYYLKKIKFLVPNEFQMAKHI